jgi:maltooligosyltrehalose trehalohydrolase
MMAWSHPEFGAVVVEQGVRFRVHAPLARRVAVTVLDGPARGRYEMACGGELWELLLPHAAAGNLYHLTVDDSKPLPDPASRFQPHGVHGPSEIVDPARFTWTDQGWRGPSSAERVLYEVHVGAFTEQGTFGGVMERLPDLRDLGVTAVELMPVADFAGDRNWGYDGVALYAPSRAYGRPDHLRALVDRAHALGIAVILDVVFNHFGPEGAYLPAVNPEYLASRDTPWGCGVNVYGPGCAMVRRFIIDNAVHWVREYHLDGLRLDATHALIDRDPDRFMRRFSDTVRGAARWPIALHAEDHRNLNEIVSCDRGGWGFDGLWADDFHHIVRRMVAGDALGYYEDFEGTSDELARAIRQGWLFTGEPSRYLQTARGTDASRVPMHRSIVCIQNHDQIGNRAFGDRLNHQVDAATWRAVSALLLTVPMTPLIFMGQEWAASTPFQYFTDLEPALGRLVTEGRRREFAAFPDFSGAGARERIPDPQAADTFLRSRLRWDERREAPHTRVLALYRTLLHLRRVEPALQASDELAGSAWPVEPGSLVIRRALERTDAVYWIVVCLRGAGVVDLGRIGALGLGERRGAWQTVLTTEEPAFAEDPLRGEIAIEPSGPIVRFERPGAVILRETISS